METVYSRLAGHAAARPDHTALVAGNLRISYAELWKLAGSNALTVRNYPPNPGVALITTDPIQAVTGFLRAHLAGGIPIVCEPRWSAAQLRSALGQVPAAGLVTNLRSAGEVARVPTAGAPKPFGYPDGPAMFVGFTSGTSGEPRAFRRSIRSWTQSFDTATAHFEFTSADVVAVPGPLSHSLFLFAALHGLWLGATVVLLRRFEPAGLARTIARHRATRIWAVPTMMAAARDELSRLDRDSLNRVRGIYCSGSGWGSSPRRACQELFPRAKTVDFYGASELSFVAFNSSSGAQTPPEAMQVFPSVEVKVDEDSRIFARSPMVFDGYLDGAPGPSPGGWVTAGDLGRLTAGGRLQVMGRATSMLLCGGQNVFPEPIERVLTELVEVEEAAVVGLPDDRWGEIPVAVVRWNALGPPLSRTALASHCRERLKGAVKPRLFLSTAEIPHTDSGKIARDRLSRMLQSGTLAAEPVT